MGCDIIYGSAFVKVTDNKYLPIVLFHSHGEYEIVNGKREKAKNWILWEEYDPETQKYCLLQTSEKIINDCKTTIKRVIKEYGEDKSVERIKKYFGEYYCLHLGNKSPTANGYIKFFEESIVNALTIEQLRQNGINLILDIYTPWRDPDKPNFLGVADLEERILLIEKYLNDPNKERFAPRVHVEVWKSGKSPLDVLKAINELKQNK